MLVAEDNRVPDEALLALARQLAQGDAQDNPLVQRARRAARGHVDPLVVAMLQRAADIADRRGPSDIRLEHVLEALLFQRITAAVIHHVVDAGSISADRGDGYVTDTHVLLAMVRDRTSLVSQELANFGVDLDAFTARLDASLDAGRRWDAAVRAVEQERGT